MQMVRSCLSRRASLTCCVCVSAGSHEGEEEVVELLHLLQVRLLIGLVLQALHRHAAVMAPPGHACRLGSNVTVMPPLHGTDGA